MSNDDFNAENSNKDSGFGEGQDAGADDHEYMKVKPRESIFSYIEADMYINPEEFINMSIEELSGDDPDPDSSEDAADGIGRDGKRGGSGSAGGGEEGGDGNSGANDAESDGEENKVRMELYDWLQCVVSAVICGIFIFVFIGRTIGVEGDSMRQTLHYYDRIIMTNLFYTPKNGDVIVFRAPSDVFGGTPLVKRVIAVAGQSIDIDFSTGDVFVDGVALYEPYINEPTTNRLSFQGPVTVPEGYVFVMGDNRNHSSDSRDSRVGLVDTRYILG